MKVSIRINGQVREADVEPRLLLAQFIRDVCGLTGTHLGCETSLCGACTVRLDGKAVKACTVLAVQADGGEVVTVEGLAGEQGMHPLQEAFWDCHGLQCGFCTPGMLMTGCEILARNPAPGRDEIRAGLKGNLCRCTGYSHIIDAVERAGKGTPR
jgi:carbon-monoxide dehydrogenase small subunit